MNKLKVPILDNCPECKGQAYLPAGQEVSNSGETYMRYLPCPTCNGNGAKTRWVELAKFATLLHQAACQHAHISATGGWHFSNGDVYDDIHISCTDCGAHMD